MTLRTFSLLKQHYEEVARKEDLLLQLTSMNKNQDVLLGLEIMLSMTKQFF